MSTPDPKLLLAWYDSHARTLPWRVPPQPAGRRVLPDPYRVWLSEIMLQQTTVAAVKGYFDDFTRRWPSLADLAAADLDDVLRAWAGLGYYSRARNLKACANAVVADHGGAFPDNETELRKLPGIGAYTAAAIAAIAFDRPAVVVDGNVERVVSRLFRLTEPLPGSRPLIREKATLVTPNHRPGDFAQAMMDLGATICTPRKPVCGLCPWEKSCLVAHDADVAQFPRKAPKTARPTRHGTVFVVFQADGSVLLRKRPEKGLLGGMAEVPGTEWTAQSADHAEKFAPFICTKWTKLNRPVEHTFTHFHLVLSVWTGVADHANQTIDKHWWSSREAVAGEALPTVMRKVLKAAEPHRPGL
ncbi:A/G-specific adenine glycosylase [Hartmannibacter diazotrophicus]|uniref:Adenine DNA glycosylase n=1 Tax=Hartmannibacter diazotrophicus TaxID=1482074 RepID=A0A2C9D592_9HYPH|nr:A/G-specific adenine glycosylase [Hartmannibacter diazotrophicus]SON54675.1 A/G-specific adenine glycosylase [Hartmannibacter diazotrophicus]